MDLINFCSLSSPFEKKLHRFKEKKRQIEFTIKFYIKKEKNRK